MVQSLMKRHHFMLIPIEVSTLLLIKAKACKSNWTDSQVIAAQYAIDGATGTLPILMVMYIRH